MAKTTVDLVQMLRAIHEHDQMENMPSITIWADGSYIIKDGGNADIIDSDHIEASHPLADIHGIVTEADRLMTNFVECTRTKTDAEVQ